MNKHGSKQLATMAWAEAVLTHQMNVGHIWRGKATFQKHCHTHTVVVFVV